MSEPGEYEVVVRTTDERRTYVFSCNANTLRQAIALKKRILDNMRYAEKNQQDRRDTIAFKIKIVRRPW